jgi:hypothetical protein
LAFGNLLLNQHTSVSLASSVGRQNITERESLCRDKRLYLRTEMWSLVWAIWMAPLQQVSCGN